MSRRRASRYLLSLLMLWQLFASAYAHPLGLSRQSMPAPTQAATGAVHCHEQGMPMSALSDMDMSAVQLKTSHSRQGHGNSCKAGCKCPCGGTPALSFVLAFFASVGHETTYATALTAGLGSQPPSKLLRPPI